MCGDVKNMLCKRYRLTVLSVKQQTQKVEQPINFMPLQEWTWRHKASLQFKPAFWLHIYTRSHIFSHTETAHKFQPGWTKYTQLVTFPGGYSRGALSIYVLSSPSRNQRERVPFSRIVAVRADREKGSYFMLFWKKGILKQQQVSV